MYREIIFRGIRMDNGQWTYGSLMVYDTKEETVYSITNLEDPAMFVPVYPESIGQFSGLYDCNGRKVYENDILEYLPTGQRYPVDFISGAFMIDWCWDYLEWYDREKYKVVSNRWTRQHEEELKDGHHEI